MGNFNFERDQINLFKKMKREIEHVGLILEMKKFAKFWGNI